MRIQQLSPRASPTILITENWRFLVRLLQANLKWYLYIINGLSF